MSLPPGFLDELRDRISIADVAGTKVVWDERKSNRGKGDLWAPCPFHQEKTASFHVDDRKGFYYCFGCHAKGDAIAFVRETENLGFMEAVERLASDVGLAMPARDPRAAEKADRSARLAEVMERAIRFYRRQLASGGGAGARSYLEGRGLDAGAQERWELGFAPNARAALAEHLAEAGIGPDLAEAAGLTARPEDGGAPYDRFRGRVVFPIRDGRGRAIAFGGRALDPSARAKYLNSPQTILFDKGRSLFNHRPAREAVGRGAALIVAEGYMDVIALAEAGFDGAVAPLGTAITEEQLRLLWRIHPEPVVALDGDEAGLRAARRLIDVALPMIAAGQSLRFALMPAGQDPDDVIRAGGVAAMRAHLDAAEPMVRLLWAREVEGGIFDSPERRAALDARLARAVAGIGDPAIRRHYADELKRLRWELFRARPAGRRDWRARGPEGPRSHTRRSVLAGGDTAGPERLREAVILATLVVHPDLVLTFEAELERLDTTDATHARLRDALLRHAGTADLRAALVAELGGDPLETLDRTRHVALAPGLRHRDDRDVAEASLLEEFGKLAARRGARREMDEAVETFGGMADEGLTWRLGQAAGAVSRAERRASETQEGFDLGPNGAKLNRAERSALHALIDTIGLGGTSSEGGPKRDGVAKK